MPPACSAFGCLRIPKRYSILPFPLSKRTLDRPPFKQVFSNPICTYSTSLFCGRETESFLIFFGQPFPIACVWEKRLPPPLVCPRSKFPFHLSLYPCIDIPCAHFRREPTQIILYWERTDSRWPLNLSCTAGKCFGFFPFGHLYYTMVFGFVKG